jgi:hypothetical protein
VIRDPQDWPNLTSLNFSRNRLKDDGVKELANVVFKRSQNLLHDMKGEGMITTLSVSETELTDVGFKYML